MSNSSIQNNKIKQGLSLEAIKILLLAFYFFFVFGAYTLLKDLKDSIFMITVGTQYIPQIKTISLLCMIPLVMLYGYLSKVMKRKNLLIFYTSIYGFGSLILAYFILHPTIGLHNTISNPTRLFGWISYLFLDGASPFLVSLSWSFLSSISFPLDIKKTYLIMTIMSKLGGALFACIGWLLCNNKYINFNYISDVNIYNILMKISGFSILCLPIIIFFMYFLLPPKLLIGYNNENDEEPQKNNGNNSFGLLSLLKNSYVFSIFGMVFFWEIINFIFNNLRLNVAFKSAESIGQISSYLFQSTMLMHLIGLLFVIFGTSFFIRKMGERAALLAIPILTGLIIFLFIFHHNPFLINIFYPFLGAINYSLSRPIRESLFIVTSKKIQFSTKQWIDSFGQKFSKSCGSLYTISLNYIAKNFIYNFQICFFIVLFFFWTLLAWHLGKKWQNAITNNKIIS